MIFLSHVVTVHNIFVSDIDECATGDHTCHVNADCSNTNGSFSCSCITGYSGDGKTCIG